jgi:hypothetical protein
MAFIFLVSVTDIASAQETARTKKICWDVNYDQKERMADAGDKDAVFCSAVANAASYTDETLSQAERQKRRVIAINRYNKARELGFAFERIVMFGMTFQQLIADGDRLMRSGGVRPSQGSVQGDFNACMAQIGTACMGQCGGDSSCFYRCNGSNAWQCRQ